MTDFTENGASAKAAINRRTLLKGAASLAAGAALPAPLAGPAFAADTPRKGGRLIVGLTGGETTDSLDPTLANAQVIGDTLHQFLERLVLPSPDGRSLEPHLAVSWDHSADLKTWTFKIRDGVTFHNKKPLTAKDVVFSVNRHRGPDSKSGAAGSLKSIQDIKATGDLEVTFTLDQPNVEFPFLLTDYHVVIQPDGDKGDSGIGTGAYVMTDVQHGVRYLAVKNPNYWNPAIGYVDSIETLVINDNSARVSALINGQVHLINRVEPKVEALIKKSGKVSVVPTVSRGHYVFAMRTDAAPFDNADLRMALKLAIDREGMVKQILRGYGVVGNDCPINAAYDMAPDFPQRTYDPAKAAELYKKSGHTGPIVLDTSEVAFGGAVDAAVLFSEQAAKAGIQIVIKRDPGDGYWDNVWNKAPFFATYWDGRPTQDQALSVAYDSSAPWNETAWKRPDFDALLAEARKETDIAKRAALYKAANAMIRDDGGAIIRFSRNIWMASAILCRATSRTATTSFRQAASTRRAGWRDDPMTLRMPFVLKLVVRRVIIGVVTLAAVCVLIFFGTQLLPGDAAQAILGHQATKESVAALRHALELDRPLLDRFTVWVLRLLHGDLGTSLANGRAVGPLIAERFGNTLFLAGVTAVLSVPISVGLGIASVIWRGTVFDQLLGGVSLGLISLPEFFIGYALIFLFSVQLGWVPSLSNVQGHMPLAARLFSILLPSLTLALVVSAHMMRMTKVAVINVLDAPYVEMARLKGLSVARVVGVHALANAVSPIVTVVVLNLAYLVAGIVVVEVVFVYPGMGQLIVDSVTKRDIPVVQACAVIFGSSYIGLNILADVIAIVSNPRLRFPR